MICEKCNKREAVHIHHKDGNHRNNAEANLANLCAICHAKEHNISPQIDELRILVDTRERYIKVKNAIANQIRSFNWIEIEQPPEFNVELEQFKQYIKQTDKCIKQYVKSSMNNELTNWLLSIKGISEVTAAKLMSHINIKKSSTVSQLWRYCGLDAQYTKRKKGMTEEEAKKCGNPYLKKELLGVLGDNFIKQRTPVYRDIYDTEKQKQLDRGLTKGHAHARARRKMIKLFVAHYYEVARKSEDLPYREPYAFEYLNHTTKIEPS